MVRLTKRYGLPVYVTEKRLWRQANDAPDAQGVVDDQHRIRYLKLYTKAMADAVDLGADVQGYFVWSLLDNFEWGSGYTTRFGLVHVDFETLKRTRSNRRRGMRLLLKQNDFAGSVQLRSDSEAILSAMFPAKVRDAFVISDQRTGEFDRGGDQKPVCRVAVLQMMKLIGMRGGLEAERHGLNAGTPDKALHPAIDRNIELNPPAIDKQCNFPSGDGAQKNRSAILQQSSINVRVESRKLSLPLSSHNAICVSREEAVDQCCISRPVSESSSSLRIGAIRSTPSLICTDP